MTAPRIAAQKWKAIALTLAEDVLYSRNITECLIGDLPSTMDLVRLATKVTQRKFKP